MNNCKIACVGNMNNNNFSLVRYLRGMGYDAHLFSLNEVEHFHPQHDTFSLDYQNYHHHLDWSLDHINKISKDLIQTQLKGYSFMIAEGVAMAFLQKGGFKVDVYIPYGSDLYWLPFWKPSKNIKARILSFLKKKLMNNLKETHRKEFTNFHQKAIKSAGVIICGNKELKEPIEKLGVLDKWVKLSAPIVNNRVYNPETIEHYHNRSHWLQSVQDFIKGSDFILFSHVRQYWKVKNNDVVDYFSMKGNDKFIRALARLINENQDKHIKLVMLEYGPDVHHSKQLISDLNLSSHVLWLPKSSRKEIMVCMSMAHLVVGEVNLSSLGSGVINESMVMEKPIISYREDELYKDEFDTLYPLLNAHTEDDIFQQLVYGLNNPDRLKEIGKESSQWYQTHCVDKSLSLIVSLIEKTIV